MLVDCIFGGASARLTMLFVYVFGHRISTKGVVAEWSKALALGASPKGRGFEPHLYHTFCRNKLVLNFII